MHAMLCEDGILCGCCGVVFASEVLVARPPPTGVAWPNNGIICSTQGRSPGTFGMQNGDYDGDIVMLSGSDALLNVVPNLVPR